MSERIPTDISWPDGTLASSHSSGAYPLPLPFIDYSGGPINSTVQSSLDMGVISRRSRSQAAFGSINASWVFNPEEVDGFEAFFIDVLGNGAASFQIDLKFPKNSELTRWVVRFVGGYRSQPMDDVWRVEAQLYLIWPADVLDPETALGFSVYLTADTPGEEYLTSDGFIYAVEE